MAIIIRVFVRSYKMFARQKSIEDVNPWATIIIMAAVVLFGVWIRTAAVTSPMWLIEEYAISAFRSVFRMHVIPAITVPQRATEITGYISHVVCGIDGWNRIIP